MYIIVAVLAQISLRFGSCFVGQFSVWLLACRDGTEIYESCHKDRVCYGERWRQDTEVQVSEKQGRVQQKL